MSKEVFEVELIVELIAAGYTNQEVTDIAKRRGIECDRTLVNYYRHQFKDEIVLSKKTQKESKRQLEVWNSEQRALKLQEVAEKIEEKGILLATDRNGRLLNTKTYSEILKQIGQEAGDFDNAPKRQEIEWTIAFKNLDVDELWEVSDGNVIEGEISDDST